jgi:hypothetical protein
MQLIRKNGATSNIVRVKLLNSTSGQGLTGLTFSSSGLIIGTICDNEAAATAYTAAGSTTETITTLATYAAPTATKCRFKEVDATNLPGLYELQLADARFAVSSAKTLRINISGATNLLDKELLIQLTAHDLVDSAQVQADVAKLLGTAWLTPAVAGTPDVNAKQVGGSAVQQTGGYVKSIESAGPQTWWVAGQASGTIQLSNPAARIRLVAKSGGTAAGTEGNGTKTLAIAQGSSEATAYNTGTDTLTVTINISGGHNTIANLLTVINAGTHFAAYSHTTTDQSTVISTSTTGTGTLSGYISGVSDSNSGLQRIAPFATIEQAASSANPGDTIRLVGGVAITGLEFDPGKNGLTFIGEGFDTIVSGTGFRGVFYLPSRNDIRLLHMKIVCGVTNVSKPIYAPLASNLEIGWCEINGDIDGIHSPGCLGLWIHHNIITSLWDVIMASSSVGVVIENNSYLYTDGSSNGTGTFAETVHGIAVAGTSGTANSGSVAIIRNNNVKITRAVAATGYTHGIDVGTDALARGAVLIENNRVSASVTSASATGEVIGIAGSGQGGASGQCIVRGGSVETSHANGSATCKDIYAPSGIFSIEGVQCDYTKVGDSPYVRDKLSPTAANRTLDVSATGEAGMDWGNVGSPTTANALTNTSLKLTAAGVDDIWDEAISGHATSGTTGAALAAGGTTISPFNVDADHTWILNNPNQVTSPKILAESIGFVGLVAVDFDKPIPALSSIASVTAASFANIAGTEPTVSATAVSADKRKAVITIDCTSATAGTYTLSVTIVTTDSQTFVRKGQITIS